MLRINTFTDWQSIQPSRKLLICWINVFHYSGFMSIRVRENGLMTIDVNGHCLASGIPLDNFKDLLHIVQAYPLEATNDIKDFLYEIIEYEPLNNLLAYIVRNVGI